jgi:hypothetical protein
MKINTKNMNPGRSLEKQVTHPPPADLSDTTDGDKAAPQVEIGTQKSAQQTIEKHTQTSSETLPEPELIGDQPKQRTDSAHMKKKVEEMEQQDIKDIQVRKERKTRVKSGPKITPCTSPNTSWSMSVVAGEWGVMETKTHKLKQDELIDDSQQQPKRQKKIQTGENTDIGDGIHEHSNTE